MDLKQIIPLVGQLLDLGFKIADIIDRAEDVDPADKELLKARIRDAQAGVKYWTDDPAAKPANGDVISETPEGVTVADDGSPMINDGDGPLPELKPVTDNN